MPTFGLLDAGTVESRLPRLASLDTEAWALPGAEILQLAWETRPTTDGSSLANWCSSRGWARA